MKVEVRAPLDKPQLTTLTGPVSDDRMLTSLLVALKLTYTYSKPVHGFDRKNSGKGRGC